MVLVSFPWDRETNLKDKENARSALLLYRSSLVTTNTVTTKLTITEIFSSPDRWPIVRFRSRYNEISIQQNNLDTPLKFVVTRFDLYLVHTPAVQHAGCSAWQLLTDSKIARCLQQMQNCLHFIACSTAISIVAMVSIQSGILRPAAMQQCPCCIGGFSFRSCTCWIEFWDTICSCNLQHAAQHDYDVRKRRIRKRKWKFFS